MKKNTINKNIEITLKVLFRKYNNMIRENKFEHLTQLRWEIEAWAARSGIYKDE